MHLKEGGAESGEGLNRRMPRPRPAYTHGRKHTTHRQALQAKALTAAAPAAPAAPAVVEASPSWSKGTMGLPVVIVAWEPGWGRAVDGGWPCICFGKGGRAVG